MMAFSADEFMKYNEYSHYDSEHKEFVDDNFPNHEYKWDNSKKTSEQETPKPLVFVPNYLRVEGD